MVILDIFLILFLNPVSVQFTKLTIVNFEDVVSHPDGDGAGQDGDPGGQDQVLGVGGGPQCQGAHREHHGQEPGHGEVIRMTVIFEETIDHGPLTIDHWAIVH